MNYIAVPGMKWKGTYEEIQTVVPVPNRQERLVHAVMKHYGITWGQMLSRSRKREIVVPRQVAMYLLHKMLGLGCAGSARVFNLDHTTAIHSFRLIQNLIDTDENFRNEIRGIKENIL